MKYLQILILYLTAYGGMAAGPEVLEHPSSQPVERKDDAVMEAKVEGAEWFQWYFHGRPLIGETAPWLRFAPAYLNDDGEYWLIAGNQAGTVQTKPARLSVTPDEVVYYNNFDERVSPEWSREKLSRSPAFDRQFLGLFGTEEVALTLDGLPKHTDVLISFQLFVKGSWEGNSESNIWQIRDGSGTTLFETTFSTTESLQAFPAEGLGGDYPANTGAHEVNSLGYLKTQGTPSAVYDMQVSFRHEGEAVSLSFAGIGLEHAASWGIENIAVSVLDMEPEFDLGQPLPVTAGFAYTRVPWNMVVEEGESAVMTMQAVGREPTSYSCEGPDGELESATGRFVVDGKSVNVGAYTCWVQVGQGSHGPLLGKLAVVTSQLKSRAVWPGERTAFEVAVEGDVKYAWRLNNKLISEATGPALVLESVRPEQEGEYSVIIYDDSGSLVQSAFLEVNQIELGMDRGPALLLQAAPGHTYRIEHRSMNHTFIGSLEELLFPNGVAFSRLLWHSRLVHKQA